VLSCIAVAISVLILAAISEAAPVITIIAPGNGAFAGSPVFYQASATSPGCAKGIAAMRIYTAPHQAAFTTSGSHLETFINLAPGRYNTVVQAWDNCGGVAKTPVALTVSSAPGITVFNPHPVLQTPVHIPASAQSPSCPAGINAMRVYVANGTAPYTVSGNKLDVYLNLLQGNRNITVQAWDNCGHVFKFAINEFVGTPGDNWVYSMNVQPNSISQFNVNSSGVLSIPNGGQTPIQVAIGTNPKAIAVDPGGWFVYASTDNGIYAFEVDSSNGQLRPVQGSPFALTGKSPVDIAMDSGGNFLYAAYAGSNTVADYKIDRSSGALSPVTSVTGLPGLVGLTSDFSGQYVYALGVSTGTPSQAQIVGYKLNQNNGHLTSVPGGPYILPNDSSPESITATTNYLYADADQDLFGFAINYSTGALTLVPGTPVFVNQPLIAPQDLIADRFGRYVWSGQSAPTFPPQGWLSAYRIETGGTLSPNNTNYDFGNHDYFALTESYRGKYLYGGGAECTASGCTGTVKSWSLDASGGPQSLSGPLNAGGFPFGIVVVRQYQD
jgi:hypothetical protein